MSNSKLSAQRDYKVVVITWGDAFIETDDFTEEEAQKTEPLYRKTVGFLIVKNQHGYVLSTDVYLDPESDLASRLFIPLGMVVNVEFLT